ncbi:hypothetical protein JYT44_03190 [Caldithrix abyssi]|nr:hypothetical protein [Caldithrix abyssi]
MVGNAVEPKIGHLKNDNRMNQNHLKGKAGDRINALPAGSGANMRKLLTAFFLFLLKTPEKLRNMVGCHWFIIQKQRRNPIFTI